MQWARHFQSRVRVKRGKVVATGSPSAGQSNASISKLSAARMGKAGRAWMRLDHARGRLPALLRNSILRQHPSRRLLGSPLDLGFGCDLATRSSRRIMRSFQSTEKKPAAPGNPCSGNELTSWQRHRGSIDGFFRGCAQFPANYRTPVSQSEISPGCVTLRKCETPKLRERFGQGLSVVGQWNVQWFLHRVSARWCTPAGCPACRQKAHTARVSKPLPASQFPAR
jgi:hypothetical protein